MTENKNTSENLVHNFVVFFYILCVCVFCFRVGVAGKWFCSLFDLAFGRVGVYDSGCDFYSFIISTLAVK